MNRFYAILKKSKRLSLRNQAGFFIRVRMGIGGASRDSATQGSMLPVL